MSQIIQIAQSALECPICLSPFLRPITLPCGHNYCQPCLKNKAFRELKSCCPICRRQISIKLKYFDVNLLLDKIVTSKYSTDEIYQLRLAQFQQLPKGRKTKTWFLRLYKKIRRLTEWIYHSPIVKVLLICLFFGCLIFMMRLHLRVFNMQIPQQYKSKVLDMLKNIQSEDNMDFKFILFSQLLRILFSNVIVR